MPSDERVLVIPIERFLAAGYFQGFRAADELYLTALLDPAGFQFRPRSEVETDPEYKQLIPYVVLRHGKSVFHYRRGSAGTEKRLQALRSVGIGGHVSEVDAVNGTDVYRSGMLRELFEEVWIKSAWADRLLGIINDDRTPVGRVHLGIVHVFELDRPNAWPREDALADAGFGPITELVNQIEQFETWSQFVLTELVKQ